MGLQVAAERQNRPCMHERDSLPFYARRKVEKSEMLEVVGRHIHKRSHKRTIPCMLGVRFKPHA